MVSQERDFTTNKIKCSNLSVETDNRKVKKVIRNDFFTETYFSVPRALASWRGTGGQKRLDCQTIVGSGQMSNRLAKRRWGPALFQISPPH